MKLKKLKILAGCDGALCILEQSLVFRFDIRGKKETLHIRHAATRITCIFSHWAIVAFPFAFFYYYLLNNLGIMSRPTPDASDVPPEEDPGCVFSNNSSFYIQGRSFSPSHASPRAGAAVHTCHQSWKFFGGLWATTQGGWRCVRFLSLSVQTALSAPRFPFRQAASAMTGLTATGVVKPVEVRLQAPPLRGCASAPTAGGSRLAGGEGQGERHMSVASRVPGDSPAGPGVLPVRREPAGADAAGADDDAAAAVIPSGAPPRLGPALRPARGGLQGADPAALPRRIR